MTETDNQDNQNFSMEGTQSGKPPSHLWYICFLLANVSSGLMTPLMPLFVYNYLHSSIFYYGVTSAIASLASSFALIIWGNLSDSVGKRKIFVLIAFFGSFLSLSLIFFVGTLLEYIITIVLFQIFSMASVPVSTLMVIENSPESQWSRTVSVFSAISSIGTVAGLVFGLIIVETNISDPQILRLIYLVSAFIYLAAFVGSMVLLKEPSSKVRRRQLSWLYSVRTTEKPSFHPLYVLHVIKFFRKKKESFKPILKYYFVVCLILMFAFQLFFIPYPVFMLQQYGASETVIYVMYLVNSIFSTVSFNYASAYIRRASLEKSLYAPVLIRVIAFSVAASFPLLNIQDPWGMLIALMIYGSIGTFWSIINITQITIISSIAKKVNRGRAIGYYNSILGVGQIAAGIVSGTVLLLTSYTVDFSLAAIMAIFGLFLFARKKEFRNISKLKDEPSLVNF